MKYLAVPGDGDTLSITLAIGTEDGDLRAALSDPDGFEHACRLLPGPGPVLPGRSARAVGGVRPMGGLLNRLRRFTDDDGRPPVLGFHAVGDAHTCTNPLYGRGCSLAVVQALLPRRRLRRAPGRPRRPGGGLRGGLRAARSSRGTHFVGPDGPAGRRPGRHRRRRRRHPTAKAMAAVFVAAADRPGHRPRPRPLLEPAGPRPRLMADAEPHAGSMEVMADPDAYPVPAAGRARAARELLAALAAERGSPRQPAIPSARSRPTAATLHVVEAGEGPLVVLAHGFPELGYSWRHQIPALAEAGYQVLAPDQRGYGRSSRPEAIEDYDIVHLTGDLLGLLDDAGAEQAVFVGHDWGAMVVWPLALLAPERVAGVVGMSVPFMPRAPMPPITDDAPGLRRRLLLHALLPGAGGGRRRPRQGPGDHDAPHARRR